MSDENVEPCKNAGLMLFVSLVCGKDIECVLREFVIYGNID